MISVDSKVNCRLPYHTKRLPFQISIVLNYEIIPKRVSTLRARFSGIVFCFLCFHILGPYVWNWFLRHRVFLFFTKQTHIEKSLWF